ncbi:MAG: hypothetical protein ACRCW9_06370 [Cetobacterium sp.]
MIEHETFKALIAYQVGYRIIKKVILPEILYSLDVIKRLKHLKQKTIKRRNTNMETIYTSLIKKRNFWMDILKMKENLDLIEVYIVDDKDFIEKTIRYLEDKLTESLELKIIKHHWIISKKTKQKENKFYQLEKELKFLKKGGLRNATLS